MPKTMRNWLDNQFLGTSFIILLLFPLCCGGLAFWFSLAGVIGCSDAKARQRATFVLILSVLWGFFAGLGVFYAQVMGGTGK